MHLASFLSPEFTTMAVINPSERKLAKRTSMQCKTLLPSGLDWLYYLAGVYLAQKPMLGIKFLQSPHQIDIYKKIVKCWKDFLRYSNHL